MYFPLVAEVLQWCRYSPCTEAIPTFRSGLIWTLAVTRVFGSTEWNIY